MQFTKSLLLLAALTSSALARPQGHERRQTTATATSSGSSGSGWTATPASGAETTAGFGGRTAPSGADITYAGNVGSPWGSNIIEISESDAPSYKHVAQFKGQNSETWNVVFWNKYGPDGKMTGWYGNSALSLTLGPGETKYVAFDEDTNGGFAAAAGSIPTDSNGAYASTWGEFDFSSTGNTGWSGFDVSAIVPQNAGLKVQGMQICDAHGGTCSTITPGAASVSNAYTTAETNVGGIGGNISGGGPIRLAVVVDYQG
ncbi:putative allergen [Aspergillus clavatus NRRL 1]|uniref:Allergen, putative n=1 Tax=Aspergillus clavatus (strain ATCC 1007 / CBS 513.65 / DSM 816 / NCTC 3887 / NRRL 1 / QM 1276 / 107) TaxID=344612 RepID=A1CCC5_ASPCL|nr:allergen, putative [Aspergillus clavatus NRRL 1]EAW12182.1 allergen, putative [Aspergillus clavatus NRRL 1]